MRAVAPDEAGGGGELHTVQAIGDGGVGAPLVEHVGVPAGRLASALGRAFDAAQLTQLSAFLEALAERIGPDPRGGR